METSRSRRAHSVLSPQGNLTGNARSSAATGSVPPAAQSQALSARYDSREKCCGIEAALPHIARNQQHQCVWFFDCCTVIKIIIKKKKSITSSGRKDLVFV